VQNQKNSKTDSGQKLNDRKDPSLERFRGAGGERGVLFPGTDWFQLVQYEAGGRGLKKETGTHPDRQPTRFVRKVTKRTYKGEKKGVGRGEKKSEGLNRKPGREKKWMFPRTDFWGAIAASY